MVENKATYIHIGFIYINLTYVENTYIGRQCY